MSAEIFSEVGPQTSVTLAPLFLHSIAIAIPIFPEALFPINRTGSIASWVGPAVIKIFLPESCVVLLKYSSSQVIIFSGSAILPAPLSPLANDPFSTGIT